MARLAHAVALGAFLAAFVVDTVVGQDVGNDVGMGVAQSQPGDSVLRERAEEASTLKHSDAEAGYQLALDTLSDAELAGDPWAVARAQAAAGENLNILGRNRDALNFYQRAMLSYRDLGSVLWQGRVLRMMGVSYYDMGQSDQALASYIESLQHFELAEQPLEAAKTRSNIGNVYWSLDNYSQAIDYQREALRVFDQEGFTMGIAGVAMNLGSSLRRKGQDAEHEGNADLAQHYYQQSLEFHQQSLEAFTDLGVDRGIQKSLNNLGNVALSLGQREQAEDYFTQSLAMAEAVGDRTEVFLTRTNLLQVYLADGRLELAGQIVDAIDSPDDTPVSEDVRHGFYANAVTYYEQVGDYEKALRYERLLRERITDTIRAETNARVAELELQLRAQEQQQEIEDLRREQRVSQLALARQRIWRNSAFVGGGVILVLLITLYSRYRMRVKTNQQLERVANSDSLTGLLNRRGMMPRIAHEFARFDRNQSPFSLILCDIDDFKRINDEFGHDTGDAALAAVARRIDRRLRASDLAARWGGEEFLLLLPDTELAGARELAEAVRGEIRRDLQVGRESISLSLSCGVAQIGVNTGVDALIRAADQALLQAKRSGKDQVVTALKAVS